MDNRTKKVEDLLEFLEYSFDLNSWFSSYCTIFIEISSFKKLTNYLEENGIEYTVVS